MSARPAAGLLVSALRRRVEGAGGSAMVLAKGDATAGAMLIVIAHRGRTVKLLERMMTIDGYGLLPTGPQSFDDPLALSEYVARRRCGDPDLWVVELDGADVEELAAELLSG